MAPSPTRPSRPSLAHLATLSDDVGVLQHAFHDVPRRSAGYCTDDVARAFMVALEAGAGEPGLARRLAGTYLGFLYDAQLPDGQFHNFMGYDRNWQDLAGSHDASGRAVWALGYGLRYAPGNGWRAVCLGLLQRAVGCLDAFGHLRPRAYAIVGLAHAAEADAGGLVIREALATLSAGLVRAYEEHRGEGWSWFEDTMTYDNARIPEALFHAGRVLRDGRLIEIARESLSCYESIVIEDGMFVPIGNDGWHPRGGPRARYGQQPLEAAALVDAALAARTVLGDPRYEALARIALDWFHGRNTDGAVMVTAQGGCRDGIDAHGVNQNMGAESTLAYLASTFAVMRATTEVVPIVT